jgi:hypothetical protein
MPAPERGEGGGWTGIGVGIGWAQAVGGEGGVAGKSCVKMMRKYSALMTYGRFKFPRLRGAVRLLVTAATVAVQLQLPLATFQKADKFFRGRCFFILLLFGIFHA